MATKAELESQITIYKNYAKQSKAAVTKHDYALAVKEALKSFPFIDGMIQFERKYEEAEEQQHPTIDIVLSYAPILFRWDAIDEVEDLLDKTRRIEKSSDIDWRKRIELSRKMLGSALRLWMTIESQTLSALGDADINRVERIFLITAWEQIGLIVKHAVESDSKATCTFATNMASKIRAKCRRCGNVCGGKKEAFLSEVKCPSCSATGHFIILVPITRKG